MLLLSKRSQIILLLGMSGLVTGHWGHTMNEVEGSVLVITSHIVTGRVITMEFTTVAGMVLATIRIVAIIVVTASAASAVFEPTAVVLPRRRTHAHVAASLRDKGSSKGVVIVDVEDTPDTKKTGLDVITHFINVTSTEIGSGVTPGDSTVSSRVNRIRVRLHTLGVAVRVRRTLGTLSVVTEDGVAAGLDKLVLSSPKIAGILSSSESVEVRSVATGLRVIVDVLHVHVGREGVNDTLDGVTGSFIGTTESDKLRVDTGKRTDVVGQLTRGTTVLILELLVTARVGLPVETLRVSNAALGSDSHFRLSRDKRTTDDILATEPSIRRHNRHNTHAESFHLLDVTNSLHRGQGCLDDIEGLVEGSLVTLDGFLNPERTNGLRSNITIFIDNSVTVDNGTLTGTDSIKINFSK